MPSVFGSLGSFGRRRPPGPRVAPADRRPRLLGEPVDRLPDPLAEVRRGARRRITVVGEEVLATPCEDVTEFGTKDLRELVNDMFATNAVAHGAGLAANQIGVGLRLFVYDCADAYDIRHVGHIANPVVEALDPEDAGTQVGWEGCLSVPGAGEEVSRAFVTVVTGVDQRGNPVRIEGTGLFARCLQHETDHTNGLLYLDHLSPQARAAALEEMEAEKEETWAEWDRRALELGKG